MQQLNFFWEGILKKILVRYKLFQLENPDFRFFKYFYQSFKNLYCIFLFFRTFPYLKLNCNEHSFSHFS